MHFQAYFSTGKQKLWIFFPNKFIVKMWFYSLKAQNYLVLLFKRELLSIFQENAPPRPHPCAAASARAGSTGMSRRRPATNAPATALGGRRWGSPSAARTGSCGTHRWTPATGQTRCPPVIETAAGPSCCWEIPLERSIFVLSKCRIILLAKIKSRLHTVYIFPKLVVL